MKNQKNQLSLIFALIVSMLLVAQSALPGAAQGEDISVLRPIDDFVPGEPRPPLGSLDEALAATQGLVEEALVVPPAQEDQKPTLITGAPARDSVRLKLLNERVGISMDVLVRMTEEEVKAAIERNAEKLEALVYRVNEQGEMEVLADGRKKPGARPSSKVAGLPRINAQTPPSAAELIDRINRAVGYFRSLYAETSNYGFVSEYIGYPLWLNNRASWPDYTWPRQLGTYWQNKTYAMGRVTWGASGTMYDLMDVQFDTRYNWDYNEPYLWADRYYTTAGSTSYQVYVRTYNACDPTDPCNYDPIDLYLGDYLMLSNVHTAQLPQLVTLNLAPGRMRTHRYMARIGGQAGRRVESFLNDSAGSNGVRSLKIGQMLRDFNYVWDGYDPFFNESAFLPDDFMFQNYAFPDCDLQNNGVDTVQPRGKNPYRYPYESKVCLGRAAYILLSRQDYISTGLQAIHILNKYNNPDYAYTDPRTGMGTVTPRQIARWYEQTGWNGIGIRYFGKDPAYASGLRTDIFWILETLLGYKFGDNTSRYYSDVVAAQSTKRVWGAPPFPAYSGDTVGWGIVTRPNYDGAPLLAWKRGNSFDFGFPDPWFVQDVLDFLNMPKETIDIGPISVSETTMTYIQAARVYLYYKYGQTYGSYKFYPRADIKIPANNFQYARTATIGLDTDPGWRAWDLLQQIRNAGALATGVAQWWNGFWYTCSQTLCPSTPTYTNSRLYWNFSIPWGAAVDIYLPPWSPAVTIRPGGPPVPAVVTYPLRTGATSLITFPEFSIPRVSMNSGELLTAIEAAGCSYVQLLRKNPTGFGWTRYYRGDPIWEVEQNAPYYINTSTNCNFTP